MKKILLALCLTALLPVSPAPAATDKRDVYTAVTGREMRELMQRFGYPVRLGKDSGGDPLIETTLDGTQFKIYFYGCDRNAVRTCKSIQIVAALRPRNPQDAARINAWNREQRHGKAFRRKNGDVVLHMNINIQHGLTIGNLRVWLDWWRLGLRGFKRYVGN
ncbi:MAG: YbjN domain-containing protein [Alphaproteobacteria bacterium]|nr:YbjN domain-containing protein [Alphaproteobacteria bacterium]